MVKEIKSEEEFHKEVLKSKGYVLIDFWAEWCGPCRMVAPVFEKLSNEISDVKFVKVNVDELPQIAGQFGIMSIPTLIIMKDGTPVNQTVGALPEPMLRDFIKSSKKED